MTAPVAPPPGPSDSATTRWQARASSLSETLSQLTRIWTDAADRTEQEDHSDGEREQARGDPRLGPRLDHTTDRDVRVRMRTSVLTLVVVALHPEIAQRAMAIVAALSSRHPSRAIILSPGDPDGPTSFDARISASCHLSALSGAEVCTEEILVRTGGELSQHLSTVVNPLLIHDLPVVLWWPDDPPFGTQRFRDLSVAADSLLVDSGTFRGDGLRGLAGMAETIATDAVHDIGWMRLSLWRELLAGLFDHPLLVSELPYLRSIRVDVARPAQMMRVSKAACYAGWLAAMLGWQVTEPLRSTARDGMVMRGTLRKGRRAVPVEIRGVKAGLQGSNQGAGSLMRVELEMSRGRAVTRARITRQADHLLATADWNGAQVARRAGRLEPFEETPFLAEALDQRAHDRIFEMALERAVALAADPGTSPR